MILRKNMELMQNKWDQVSLKNKKNQVPKWRLK